nr:hypothetical protein [Croceibacterium ferulae]
MQRLILKITGIPEWPRVTGTCMVQKMIVISAYADNHVEWLFAEPSVHLRQIGRFAAIQIEQISTMDQQVPFRESQFLMPQMRVADYRYTGFLLRPDCWKLQCPAEQSHFVCPTIASRLAAAGTISQQSCVDTAGAAQHARSKHPLPRSITLSLAAATCDA